MKERKPRKVKDFSTGERKTVALSPIPAFTPSKGLLNAVAPNKKPIRESKDDKGVEVDHEKKQQRVVRSFEVSKVENKKKKESKTHRLIEEQQPKLNNFEDAEDCVVVQSEPNPEQRNDTCIRYTPVMEFVNKNSYPIVWMPKANSLLKLPRQGRSDVRGYKEADFLQELKSSDLNIGIKDDGHLMIKGRQSPYEPDIILYDKPLGLFIDVEIDEPYNGFSRLATHTIEGYDDIRNTYFSESGWIVIRFTEHQVHTNPKGCVDFINAMLNGLRKKRIGQNTESIDESRWTVAQAVVWERDLYREKYLGIQGFSKETRHQKILCTGEDLVESYIERTPLHDLEAENALSAVCSSKGKNIVFDEKTHTYFPEDNPSGNADSISVTTLIEKFFPYFDQESYIKKMMAETGKTRDAIEEELKQPSLRGTDMHKQIELFLKGETHDENFKEFKLFKDFYQNEIIGRNLHFVEAEKSIILPEYNIAGTVDALFKKNDGKYVMVDWKRSSHLIIDGYPKKYGYGRGVSVINHLDNSSYYKYELQQSFYKYILEKEYGITISSMILAVLHPDYDRYYAIRLSDYRKDEVVEMMEAIDLINN